MALNLAKQVDLAYLEYRLMRVAALYQTSLPKQNPASQQGLFEPLEARQPIVCEGPHLISLDQESQLLCFALEPAASNTET